MKTLSIETKSIAGRDYNLVKGWAPKGFSISDYRAEIEGYGSELVSCERLAGDRDGSLFDIVIAL